MSRTTRRSAVVAVAGLASAIGGLAIAPIALAAPAPLPTPVLSHTTVVPGQWFTLSVSGCLPDTPGAGPAASRYQSNDLDGLGLGSGGQLSADGSHTFDDHVPKDSVPGTYTISVVCDRYTTEQAYPPITMTVVAVGTPTDTPPTDPAPPTPAPPTRAAFVPGAQPNTPGIALTATGGTSTVAAPGQQMTKTYAGFRGFEKVSLVLHSTPASLGTFTADGDGVLTATFTLPAGTALGTHTLAFDGDAGSHFEETVTVTADGKALAYTGVSVAVPLIGGTVLIAAGGGALLLGHRRNAGATRA